MIPTALLVTIIALLLVGFGLMGELVYLQSIKRIIQLYYLPDIARYAILLSINVFALSLLLVRKIGLRTTGSKLKHLEKEGLAGSALAGEMVPEDVDSE